MYILHFNFVGLLPNLNDLGSKRVLCNRIKKISNIQKSFGNYVKQ